VRKQSLNKVFFQRLEDQREKFILVEKEKDVLKLYGVREEQLYKTLLTKEFQVPI